MASTNDEIAEQTQSKQARRLGKKLLIAAAKNEPSWVKRHLRLDLFSTTAKENLTLNRDNFSEVAYASARMLHNYDVPAWINNQPYYRCFLYLRLSCIGNGGTRLSSSNCDRH